VNTNFPPLTVENYKLLPETGPRYQLIQGDLYMAPAPNPFHQEISRNLQFELHSYLARHPPKSLEIVTADTPIGRHADTVRHPNRAVFLDRDGVINRPLVREGKPYPPSSLVEFEILSGVPEACRVLKELGFALVVATNQPDVGRGILPREAVETIHGWLLQQLPIDRVMTCFHGGTAFGDPCDCRKPQPGMLFQAAEALKIDLATSYMIGDRWRDVDCGFNAGCYTIFIDWGYKEKLKRDPNFRSRDLLGAVHLIEQLERTNEART
jgi:D-glycero-D-manno-heptose 1,7-bisphosphate phosphatase